MPSYTLPKMPKDTKDERYDDYTDAGCCKYAQAFKNFVPFRPTPKNKNILPTRYAGFFSHISVNWMSSLMWKAYKKKLKEEDLWDLPREESTKFNCDRLERHWQEEKMRAKKAGKDARLWRAVWRFSRTKLIACQFLAMFIDISFFVGPMVFLESILNYINSPGIDHIYGASLFFGKILITALLPVILFNALYIIGIQNEWTFLHRFLWFCSGSAPAKLDFGEFISAYLDDDWCKYPGSRLAGALQSMVYKKTLTLTTGSENLSAQVINFSTNDMERIFEACITCVFLIEVPFIFVMCLSYCVYAYGPFAAVGFGVYLVFYPIMAYIARCQSNIRSKTIRETDRRVGLMSEILNSIRLIKMYAWEEPFAKKIAGIRYCEMKKHRIGALLSSITNTLTPSIGILATIATLLSFTMIGHPVTSAQAFTIFSLFNLMGFTVSLVPYTVRCLAEASISISRMESLLVMPEHQANSASKDSAAFAIQIQGASFGWETLEIKEKGVAPNQAFIRQISMGDKDLDDDVPDSPSFSRVLGRANRESFTGSVPSIAGSIRESIAGSIADLRVEAPKSNTVTLFKIHLTIPHGKLIGVCGSIGSGKSSLISAICGDMRMGHGKMFVNGKVALVTQQAWIYNGTLKDNLLLGATYNEERYKEVIKFCCLQSDLDMLAAGDMTEIGDRGVNLSGGQKQRVNLARAVYSNRDILLLDDPLSAVDTKVANSIFNNCIKKYLKGKTVLLVTHAIHLLEQCDGIIVMHEGRVSEQGTHSQLLANRGDYFLMVGGMNPTGEPSEKKNTEDTHAEATSDESEEGLGLDGKLTTEETKKSGGVAGKVYKTFVKVSGGWCVWLLLLTAVVLFVLLRMLSAVWLQIWLDEGDGLMLERMDNLTEYNLTMSEEELKGSIIHNPMLWMYQTVYAGSFLFLLLVGIAKGIGIAFYVLKGASKLHNAMFKSILRSPMGFFDTTPSGRILNRFSRDLDELDIRIPFFLEFVLQGVLSVTGQAILVCTIYVWFSIPLVIVAILFVLIDIFLNAGLRELKRIDNKRKSPVIQHIGSSLSGLSVIRSFDQQELFTNRMYTYLDEHTVAQLIFRLSSRWYVFRTDMLSFLVNASITGISIFTKGMVSTASVGLALATMSAVCDFFPFLMKMKAEFQSRFTAVERLAEYSYDLESEAPAEDPGKSPPRDWPEYGQIEIKDVTLRYRSDLPLVLHNINVTFIPGQKIGVVGRTGAGKSSLISMLLRLVEVEGGSVLIDGIDVSTLGLHTLRSAISVIPQDPVLFQGSIRYNLDPFAEHSDQAVWEALEQSNLKRIVQQQEMGLQSAVSTAGENFSVGERQLICLTRALLRKSKILLLDEATASVDMETDQMIQTTIRKAFVQSTVITIAHRLNTITTYDKVMVMKEGRVVEIDSPDSLMRKPDSLFKEMMAAMGVYTVEQMRALI